MRERLGVLFVFTPLDALLDQLVALFGVLSWLAGHVRECSWWLPTVWSRHASEKSALCVPVWIVWTVEYFGDMLDVEEDRFENKSNVANSDCLYHDTWSLLARCLPSRSYRNLYVCSWLCV